MATTPEATVDGRRARRERNRAAVIDAMLSLLTEHGMPPSVEDVAARAEVSVSSVFRYFDNVDDLLHQTVDRYLDRFRSLFAIADPGRGLRAERVDRFVEARLELYEAIAPIARLARLRAPEQPPIADTLAEMRRRFLGQVREHFGPELGSLVASEAEDVAAVIDALTSFEAWDLLRIGHGRSRQRIGRIWRHALDAALPVG